MRRLLFGAAVAALAASAVGAQADRVGEEVFETLEGVGVRHTPSGAVCIGVLEKAPLANTWNYEPRTGVPSVSCEYLSEDFTAAIYIVALDPSPESGEFDAHWTGMLDGFAREFPEASPLSLPSGEGPDGNRVRAGVFALGVLQRSEMLMTEAGDWVIKARATYPAFDPADGQGAVLPLAVETARQAILAASGEKDAASGAAKGASAPPAAATVDGKSIAPETLEDDE